jgi:hypothetical protein
MIIVYAPSAPGHFSSISLRANFSLLPVVYCSIATATSPIRNFRIAALNPFVMLSTLQLWVALGLLITWVEASQDHGTQLIQISASSGAANRLKLLTMHTPQSTMQQKAVQRLVRLSKSTRLRFITVIPQLRARLQFGCHRQ